MNEARSGLRLRRLTLGSLRPRGWLLAQMRRDLGEGFAGELDRLSPHVARDLFAERLLTANGQTAWWDAESRGNWLWGYAMLAYLAGDQRHRARSDGLLLRLRETQDDDGYIGIHLPGVRYPAGTGENGELWAQSRALLALLAHHELSGDPASLTAARRAADLTLRQYGPARPHFGRQPVVEDRTGLTHGLCYVDALQWLHERTGEDAYREAAVALLQDFDAWPVPFPNDDLAAASLADPERSLRGHAVHTAEHLRAVAFGSDDPCRLRAALRKLQASVTPSGALIGDESLHGLPRAEAAYEYCTLTELLFSLARVMERLADPSLADWIERLAFNAAQGARQPNGRAIAYLCSDSRSDALAATPDSYSLLSGRHGRFKLSPTHDDVACCCNPNATRLLPHYVASMACALDDGPGLVFMLYGPSELHTTVAGVDVVVRQHTNYPFEDTIRFEVEVSQPVSMTLLLRRPGWCSAHHLRGIDGVEAGGWIRVTQAWHNCTVFMLAFDTTVRTEPYAGGGAAVLLGALQFVEAIPHRVRTLRELPIAPWQDLELLPVDRAAVAAAVPLFEASQPNLGLELARITTADPDDPWSCTPLQLVRDDLTLVPLGCAPLRRAQFLLRD